MTKQKTIQENKQKLKNKYLETVREQYRVSPHTGRVKKIYFNFENGDIHIHTYVSSTNHTKFENENIHHIKTIKGWNAFESWSEENPRGETREGMLWNSELDTNGGFESEEDVREMLIDEQFSKDFEKIIMSRVNEIAEELTK